MATKTKAAIYVRISDDATGERAGVQRQREDCRSLCEARSWPVEAIYEDNSISAYNGTRRPRYEALLSDLKAGRVNAVVCWHPDRLHRSPKELEHFIDVVEGAGAKVGTVNGGDYDLTTATGRMSARIVGAVARAESEHKSERQKRANLQRAELGELYRGKRPFGLTLDAKHVPDEVAALRQVAKMLLAGKSMRATADWLNSQGFTTTRGNAWLGWVLRRTMLSPYLIGKVQRHGEIVGDGKWKSILDDATFAKLGKLLTRPTGHSNARKHLLSGFLMCGNCGARLYTARNNGAYAFTCKPAPDRHGCGRLSVKEEQLDAYVTERVLIAVCESSRLRAALAEPDNSAFATASVLVGELKARKSELEQARFIDNTITPAAFNKLAAQLDAKLEAAEKAADDALGLVTLTGVETEPEALQKQWESADLDWQRALVAQVVESITVLPAEHRGQRFNEKRVQIAWKP